MFQAPVQFANFVHEGKLDGKPAKWRSGYIELDLQEGLSEHTITLEPDLFED